MKYFSSYRADKLGLRTDRRTDRQTEKVTTIPLRPEWPRGKKHLVLSAPMSWNDSKIIYSANYISFLVVLNVNLPGKFYLVLSRFRIRGLGSLHDRRERPRHALERGLLLLKPWSHSDLRLNHDQNTSNKSIGTR